MRVLDLFSGIGAMSLGLEWAGMQTVGFCEIEPACRFWLREHWREQPIFEDIRTLTGGEIAERCGAVDLVAGGFPCQDISSAGKGAGITGERSGLWFEMLRIVRTVRPDWVLAENVPALRTRGADTVLEGLESEGYACWPLVVGAGDAGAPHRRSRVWLVGRRRLADADCERERNANELRRSERASGTRTADACGSRPAVADASGAGLETRRGVAISASVQEPRLAGRYDATRERGWPSRPGSDQNEWEAARLVYSQRSVRGGLGLGEEAELWRREQGSAQRRTPAREGHAESRMGSAIDGASGRLARLATATRRARLRAIGNTVCPQVVEAVGRAIMVANANS